MLLLWLLDAWPKNKKNTKMHNAEREEPKR